MNEENKITAQIGKQFQRISTGMIMGDVIYLGMINENDVLVEDKPENYQEIDI